MSESDVLAKIYGRDLPPTITHVEPGPMEDSLLIRVDQQGILMAPTRAEFDELFEEHGVPRFLLVDGVGLFSIPSTFRFALHEVCKRGGMLAVFGMAEVFDHDRRAWRIFDTNEQAEGFLRGLSDDDLVAYTTRVSVDRTVTVMLRNDLTESRIPTLRGAILSLLEDDDAFVILDPAGAKAIDTAGMEYIATQSRFMMERGGCVMIAGACPEIREAFEGAGLDSTVEWYDSAETARRSAQEIVGMRSSLIQSVEDTELEHCKLLHLEGHLDAGPVMTDFERRIRELVGRGNHFLILDMGGVSSILDLGPGSLVSMQDVCDRAGGTMVLVEVPRRIHSILTYMQLTDYLKILPGVKDAITWLRRR